MRLGLALIAMISVGCGIDTAAPDPGAGPGGGSPGAGSGGNPAGDPGNGDPGEGTGPVTEVSGHITASATWSDTIHVTDLLYIDPGVTVTVMPGTTVDVTSGTGIAIAVSGTLAIQGSKAGKVVFRSATAGENWFGFSLKPGGLIDASYLVMTGGAFEIVSNSKVALTDSQMSHAGGDLMTMAGGTLDMTYSAIGLEPGQPDNTHCDMHVSGPVAITANHSNFSTAAYGLMFYGGSNADFTFTNWFSNTIDVDTQRAYPVTGDFSNSYFAAGAPSYVGFTMDQMATKRVADAGPR